MSLDSQKTAKQKNGFVFLILGLSCFFSVVVVLFFREELYVVDYSDNIFFALVYTFLLTGFFFTAIYVRPLLTSALLNLNTTAQPKQKKIVNGISYNVYGEPRPSSLAHHHGGWKAARRERRRLARAERQKKTSSK